MKRALAAAVAAFVLVGTAASASAATPAQRIAKLERLVRTQQKQINTLKKQVKAADEVGTAALFFSVCTAAITGDAFISTWGTINQVATRQVVGTQSPLSEPACSQLQVPRTQPQPPTLDAFASLMRFVNRSFRTDLTAVFHSY